MLSELIYGHFDDSQTNRDAFRYTFITQAVGIIHLIFCIAFLLCGIRPMVIYNIFIVIIYFTISKFISSITDYTKLYIFYLTEIILHAILATIFVGYSYLFMFYLLALIPVSFYMAFSVSSFNRKLFFPFLTTACVSIAEITILIYSFTASPLYPDLHRFFYIFFSIFNTIIALSTTFLFSALFAIEVNSMQLIMESEHEKLEDQAAYDPLTHFLNRRSMNTRLDNAHRNAIINDIPYSLIMGDIDHFKTFNDTYGHDCGDFVLQNISKIISAQIRSKDSACRWGGEEFLILINDNVDTTREVAERIRKAISEYEFYYEGKSLHVTMTLGVSGYYSSSKVKTLIEIADKRLYKGKENGRNQVVIS